MSADPETNGLAMPVNCDEDVIVVRHRIKLLAQEMGFSVLATTRLVTAVSELARNLVVHAKAGRVSWGQIRGSGERTGLKVVFADQGPGFADLDRALAGGFSTTGSLGLGLSGARRLVDAFGIHSLPGHGTVVEIIKWL